MVWQLFALNSSLKGRKPAGAIRLRTSPETNLLPKRIGKKRLFSLALIQQLAGPLRVGITARRPAISLASGARSELHTAMPCSTVSFGLALFT